MCLVNFLEIVSGIRKKMKLFFNMFIKKFIELRK